MADPKLYAQSNMTQWAFRDWHVGLDMGGKNTSAITAENVLLAAGPARLSQVGDNFEGKVFPLGLIEQASVSQQKMLQQIREIGSRRTYIIGSYSAGNMSLSQVLFSRASLLRVLTLASDDVDEIDNPLSANIGSGFTGQASVADILSERVFGINMQSEQLDRPIGLMMYMIDQRNRPYGAFYCEDCMIQSHALSLAGQSVAISEQVSLMFDRAIPVAVSPAT